MSHKLFEINNCFINPGFAVMRSLTVPVFGMSKSIVDLGWLVERRLDRRLEDVDRTLDGFGVVFRENGLGGIWGHSQTDSSAIDSSRAFANKEIIARIIYYKI